MAGTSFWYDAVSNASVGAVTTTIGTGGLLKIYTGTQPSFNQAVTGTLLVTLTLNNTPAFAAAAATGGVSTATANTITAGTAVSTGTAGYFVLTTSGSAIVASGAVSTTGSNLNLNSTVISTGAVVSVTSLSITQSESGT